MTVLTLIDNTTIEADTQSAMMHLDLIYNALGGAGALQVSNVTAVDTTTAGNATTGGTEGGEVLEGIF
jgi:hypothetical protein